ncbi:PemK-like protein [Halovivax limisalsi]|uniref:PemK-like protein n=1 Tax=Halovivax limisalsi TaxID=1453760 RepID=UPI001FFD04FF|nr:PemK-like protein [Halovivax limisalsi]
MTAFEDLARGDIVWGTDPLSDKGRPLLVLGTPRFPSHGVQLITVLLSSKTYHEESLTLRDEDYEAESLGTRSHALPWALATLTSASAVEYHLTTLVDTRVEDVATQSIGYLSA